MKIRVTSERGSSKQSAGRMHRLWFEMKSTNVSKSGTDLEAATKTMVRLSTFRMPMWGCVGDLVVGHRVIMDYESKGDALVKCCKSVHRVERSGPEVSVLNISPSLLEVC